MPKDTKAPKLFFDSLKGGYWLQLASSRFLLLSTEQARLHLRYAGLYGGKVEEGLNDMDKALYVAQVENAVDYAGPLAGHRCGVFQTSSGEKILVTSEPRCECFELSKDASEFPLLERFLTELFGKKQLPFVLGWLKYARQSLRHGDFRPGQLFVLAGPSDCGKSLFQALVTEFLGGRVGRPYRYMAGDTPFNRDLAAAEHLMIEDEHASTDIRTRRKFGAALKDFTVNREMSIHGKGKEALTLPTYKRVTLSVNNEPENLMILPPLDGSVLDKIMLFKCSQADLSEDRKANWLRLTNDLPALASYLQQWSVPRSMRSTRFGVTAFHNPELLELLADIAPETRLLNLIDQVLFAKSVTFWRGTAEQLEKELRGSSFGFAVEKLLYFSSASGVYLSRLAQKHPERFEVRKVNGKTDWLIKESQHE